MHSKNRKGDSKYALIGFIILLFGFLFSPFIGDSAEEKTAVSLSESQIERINSRSEHNESSSERAESSIIPITLSSDSKTRSSGIRAGTAYTVSPSSQSSKSSQSSASTGSSNSVGNNNFNRYNNQDQTKTADKYVLNLNSHKFHLPTCKDVPKIKESNYDTTSKDRETLIDEGWSPCGHCHP